MKKLLDRLRDYWAVHEELERHLYVITSDKMYRKPNFFIQAGEVDRHIWFIETGLVVIYRESGEGIKVTHILGDGDFVICIDSFDSGSPTKDNILVLEDALTWRSTQTDVADTCETHPVFNKHYKDIAADYRKKENEFNAKEPKERFDELWNTHRDYFVRVKKELLASYVGMSLSTFDNYKNKKRVRKYFDINK